MPQLQLSCIYEFHEDCLGRAEADQQSAKHGQDFAALDEGFFAEAMILPAKQGRWLAIGRLGDGSIAVVFATLGTEAISIVSMRRANRTGRKLLE